MAGGSELAATPFWPAAFVGLVAGSAPWGRWQAPSPWRLPIAWWALGIAVSWPVVAVRETGFALDDPAVAGAIVGAAVVQMACAVWLDTVLAALADATAERREAPLLRPLMASALVTALAAVYQRFGDIAWLSGESWVRLGRATGMMGDANPMGVVTALIAPLMLGGVLAGRPLHAILPAAGALLLWTAAWASGARSTLILLAAGFAGLAIAWGASRGIGLLRIIGAGMVVAVLAAALLVFALPRLPTSSPVARLVDALPAASPGAVLYELLWRRDGYGEAAVEAIAEHPLNGVGIGRFTAHAPVDLALVERRASPPDNAQNLWRHTCAERGLLGFVPVAWLTLLTLMAICRWTGGPWQIVLNVMIAGLGVVLMFGYPVQDPAVAATVATLAGIA